MKGLFIKKYSWKSIAIIFVLTSLLIPGLTYGVQLIEVVYEKSSNTPAEVGESVVKDEDKVLENKINSKLEVKKNLNFKEPVIYGKKMAFIDTKTKELILYDMESNMSQTISDSSDEKMDLEFYQGYLIWSEGGDIWLYNTKLEKIEQITNSPNISECYSSVYKNSLVYRGKGDDIFLYNLATKKIKNLSNAPDVWRSKPSIWNGIVAWADESDGYPNIYIYDIKDEEKLKITSYNSNFSVDYPVVTNKNIIYPMVDNEGLRQLRAYDIKKKTDRQLLDPERGKFGLKLDKYDGNKIIYNRTNDQVVIYDLDNDKYKELEIIKGPAVYSGLIVGKKADDDGRFIIKKY